MSSFSLNISQLSNGAENGNKSNTIGNEETMIRVNERISPINITRPDQQNISRSVSTASIDQSPPEGQQTQEQSDSNLARKVTRTRTGCLTCRRRKKKCDEQRCPDTGGCTRCKQAGYQCEGFPQLLQIENTGKVINANTHGRRKKSFHEPNKQRRKSTTTNSDRSILSVSPPEQHNSMHPQNRFGDPMNQGDANGLFALQAAASSLMASSPTRPERGMQDHFAPSSFDSHMSMGPNDSSNHLRDRTSSISSRMTDPIMLQPMQIDSHSNNQMMMTNGPPNIPCAGQTPSRYVHQNGGVMMQNDSSPGQGSNVNNYVGGSVCTFIGECILVGRQICTSCLSTIEPLFSPSDPTPNFQLPTPTSSVGGTSAFSPRESRHQPVMQSLIGYYSAVVTCWIEGCFPQDIANSSFFRDLVQYLISNIDENEALRLSVAAVASGYIGGGQLQWPEDLIAIKRWTNTLRQDTTELVDVTVSMTGQSTANRRDLENANGPDKLARHTYIDRHLSKHAMLFYRMAKRAVEEAIQRASREPSQYYRASGSRAASANDTDSDYVDPSLAKKYNSILVATVNLCIFSWAEMSIETYYEDFDLVLQAAHTLFGGIRRVKLAYLNSLDTIGLAIVCWADTCASIARGTRPYFELDESPLTEEEKQVLINSPNAAAQFAFHSFNCPSALFQCLNDLARLRFDCKAAPQRGWNGGNTEGGRQSSPLPAFLGHRAAQLDARLKALSVETQHTLDPNGNRTALTRPDGTSLDHAGSPNCSEMTRLACVLILYTGIYQKGPLHPTCKFALQSIVHLWTYGASGFCKDVGCSNYLLPVFMASVVACETRDRLLLEEAMNIVGHNEAVADASRQAVKEVWKRTDEDGFPALWTDVVRPGSMTVAFL
ncbi:uncharacterized protein FA14DRAFT_17386 [Meira miltonrushii]|uniref:Zn(2)-C6 fungal-type domain-containing protein n=1 Tax=Meira miltonrushii TaxID=1280837 RepID=A0A316VJ84_9BASI|nr:uncharacterized protein FA14DRAFT_17386 [Meira miltonrushii]PWN37669.1 hypothetical protein FA14DRAFT_17386 [Meira miltonrushii]